MSFLWEENPSVQKGQAYLVVGFVALMVVIGAVRGAPTGDWLWFIVCVALALGLVVSWAVVAVLLIVTLKLLDRLDRRRASAPKGRPHRSPGQRPGQ